LKTNELSKIRPQTSTKAELHNIVYANYWRKLFELENFVLWKMQILANEKQDKKIVLMNFHLTLCSVIASGVFCARAV
jgi:hypothetical protein